MLTSDVTNSIASVTDSDDDDDDSTPDVTDASVAAVMAQETSYPAGVRVEHSEDVQLGPRLNYNAPVIINQYVTSRGISDRRCKQLALHAPGQGFAGDGLSSETSSEEGTIDGQEPLKAESPSPTSRLNKPIAALVALFLIVVVACGSVSVGPSPEPSPPPPEGGDDNATLVQTPSYLFNATLLGGYPVYNRTEWHAYEPDKLVPLQSPATFVIISQTDSNQCSNRDECSALLRRLQINYRDNMLHNFFLDRSGNIYEGRGWDYASSIDRAVMLGNTVHKSNIYLAYIGFRRGAVDQRNTRGAKSLSREQVEATHQLLQLGVELGRLSADYKIVLLGQLVNHLTPEREVFAEVMRWEHYYDKNGTGMDILRNILVTPKPIVFKNPIVITPPQSILLTKMINSNMNGVRVSEYRKSL